MKLNLEDEVRKFVRDFNKFFKYLEAWTNNDIHIKTWKDHFLKEYPIGDSSGPEMKVDIDTTMRTKPSLEREEKLRKVEEKLLSKRTNERFTDCDGVMLDPNLTLTQKIIHIQKGIEDSTRRKTYYVSLQRELFEKCFLQPKKVYKETLEVYKETLEEMKFTRQWVLFFTKIIQTCSGLQSNYILHCSFKLHSL